MIQERNDNISDDDKSGYDEDLSCSSGESDDPNDNSGTGN